MADTEVFVSVIIATYNSGPGIQRVFRSLDSQTLPREHFEVIFVDDGSTDDTYAVVQEYARSHSNVKFTRIENSGWPSKPRNTAISMAEGEYLMFMDHDDSLYHRALESTARYGLEHGSDIVIPKEMKSNDPWWYLDALRNGSIPQVPKDSGFSRMLPMVPHKLYRREMFVSHEIKFPERRRALWEDQFINVAAYRHAKTISVLADTPFYLWHASETNTSHTFNPKNEDFWDRLEDIMSFMDTELSSSQLKNAHTSALALQIEVRVIDRLTRLLAKGTADAKEMAFPRAKALLERHLDAEIYSVLPWRHKVLSHLLAAGRPDLMEQFQAFDLSFAFTNSVHDLQWNEEGLTGVLKAQLSATDSFTGIVLEGDRARWNLPGEICQIVPSELLDVHKTLDIRLDIAIRNRSSRIVWFPELSGAKHTLLTDQAGKAKIEVTGQFLIAHGHLDQSGEDGLGVWDVSTRSTYCGMTRSRSPIFEGSSLAAIYGDTAVTAYRNNKDRLSIDTDQSLRSVVIDNINQTVRGVTESFSIPLEGVKAFQSTAVDAGLYLLPAEDSDSFDNRSVDSVDRLIDTRLTMVSTPQGVFAQGSFSAAPGHYLVYARRSGKFVKVSKSVLVKSTGHFILESNSAITYRSTQQFA